MGERRTLKSGCAHGFHVCSNQMKVKPGKEATAGQLAGQLPKPLYVNCWGKLFFLGYTNIITVPTFLGREMQVMPRVEIWQNTHRKSPSQVHRWLRVVIRAKGQFLSGQTLGRAGTGRRKGLKALIPKTEAEPKGWRQKLFQIKNDPFFPLPAPIWHKGLSG